MSQYLEGDLDDREREALEAHVGTCPRCQRELASLASTVRALGSIQRDRPAGLADSIIAALRAESPATNPWPQKSPGQTGPPALTVVGGSDRLSVANRRPRAWAGGARAALSYCVQKPQLRVTLPIALVAGVVLSLVNMGGTLVRGRIDLGVCAMCATDFLVPFVALNLVLLVVLRVPGRRRL